MGRFSNNCWAERPAGTGAPGGQTVSSVRWMAAPRLNRPASLGQGPDNTAACYRTAGSAVASGVGALPTQETRSLLAEYELPSSLEPAVNTEPRSGVRSEPVAKALASLIGVRCCSAGQVQNGPLDAEYHHHHHRSGQLPQLGRWCAKRTATVMMRAGSIIIVFQRHNAAPVPRTYRHWDLRRWAAMAAATGLLGPSSRQTRTRFQRNRTAWLRYRTFLGALINFIAVLPAPGSQAASKPSTAKTL